jgi:hypothetical protein
MTRKSGLCWRQRHLGGTLSDLIQGGDLSQPLVGADLSGPVDGTAVVGGDASDFNDSLITADINAPDGVDGGLLDGSGVGDVLNGAGGDLLNTSDLGDVLGGNTGLLDQPLASVDANGPADGSVVVRRRSGRRFRRADHGRSQRPRGRG